MNEKRPKPVALAALLAALVVLASLLTACERAASAVPTVSGTDVPPVGSVSPEPSPESTQSASEAPFDTPDPLPSAPVITEEPDISIVPEPTAGSIFPALDWLNDIGKTFDEIIQENPDAEYQRVDIIAASGQCLGIPDSKYLRFFFGAQDFPHLNDISADYGDQLRCAGIASTIGELYPDTIEQMPLEQFFSDNGVSEYNYYLEGASGFGWIEFSSDGWLVWIDTTEGRVDPDNFKEITTMKRSYSVLIVNRKIYQDNHKIREDFWNEIKNDYWNGDWKPKLP